MAKVIAPLTKLALTVSAAALGAGPLSTLPKEIIIPILKSLLGDQVTDKLAGLADDVLGNLAGDFAKEFLDSLEKELAQDLRMTYLLALRKALISERATLRNEIGVKTPFVNERQLPDEMENLFAAWLAKIESLVGDPIDVEMLFGDQPALEAIFDSTEGPWGFLKRILIEWATHKEIPEELELRLQRELPKSLTDHFTTILANPNHQLTFNKHQAHFQYLLDQKLNSIDQKTDQILDLVKALNSAQGNRNVVARDINSPVFTGNIEGDVHIHLARESIIQTLCDLKAFRQTRIKEWSHQNYRLDERFVNLTLVLDQGEERPRRLPESSEFRYQDLRNVLSDTQDTAALVLLGEPGCGKSTLLRRLQLDHSIDRLEDGSDEISFFIQLNGYRGPDPRTWLNAKWSHQNPNLPSLDSYLDKGRAWLLLDALNEMPHSVEANSNDLIVQWRSFTQEIAGCGNRLVYSCRRRDYAELGSQSELTVPRVHVQLMNRDQIRTFLGKYLGNLADQVWAEIKDSPKQLELYSTPYFLKLLCNQTGLKGGVPKDRASLFTGFIRKSLKREIERNTLLFQPGILLSLKDHEKVLLPEWRNPFDLPENGLLIPGLSDLAFRMQEKRPSLDENSQVRVSESSAKDYLANDHHEEIIRAGVALNILDLDRKQDEEIAFFHQLLQEYFAARRFAKNPDPSLDHVEWQIGRVSPSLEETLADLPDSTPLPSVRQTGWEETTRIAVPIIKDQEGFIRDLIPHNLPLAARCAAAPEVHISDELKREIQNALIGRTQDMKADLRARIAAGEALGEIGDPRFELRKGPNGDEYLMPPMVAIPGGSYPIGLNDGLYDDEEPEHLVEIAAFQIGKFPVTNAEYAKFIDAGGYENEQWWDTDEALKWLRGEGTAEGERKAYRDYRNWLLQQTEDDIAKRTGYTSEEKEQLISVRNMANDEFEELISQRVKDGAIYRQPEFWDDARFNHPSQPVVGISWFEARAYCNWLTANSHGVPPSGGTESIFRLPTEVEFEAAARGRKKRLYSYGNEFDSNRCNTFESHIRRTTPIGIFDNATPEGAYDLTGNAWTWTLSEYKDYKYQSDDGREDIHKTGIKRVLRGGSWGDLRDLARAVARNVDLPVIRLVSSGFRVVLVGGPPS